MRHDGEQYGKCVNDGSVWVNIADAVNGNDMISGHSVVLLDPDAGAQLWRAVREDALDICLQSHDAGRLGATTP
jgi:hypothetical protein